MSLVVARVIKKDGFHIKVLKYVAPSFKFNDIDVNEINSEKTLIEKS